MSDNFFRFAGFSLERPRFLRDKEFVKLAGAIPHEALVQSIGHPPPYLVFPTDEVRPFFEFDGLPKSKKRRSDRNDVLAEFASLNGEEEEIIGFARKYGLLHWAGSLPITGKGRKGKQASWELPMSSSSIWFWRGQIWWIGLLLQVWTWVEDGDEEKLREHIVWETRNYEVEESKGEPKREEGCYLYPHSEVRTIPDTYVAPLPHEGARDYSRWGLTTEPPYGFFSRKSIPIRSEAQPGNVLQAARDLLQFSVNEVFIEGITPSEYVGQHTELRPFIYQEGDGFKFSFRISSLLTTIWFQFAEALSGGRKLDICGECLRWMDITQNSKNKEMRDWCATAARVRKLRKRRTELKLFVEKAQDLSWGERHKQWNAENQEHPYANVKAMQDEYEKSKGGGT